MQKSNRKKIIVAMSGGVDSSVAALLLKKQGHDVAGAFMINWSDPYSLTQCNVEQDLDDMRRVCKKLQIPAYTWNFEKEYERNVLTPFFDGYSEGNTPNPDILCNKEIKFNIFLKKARALGADLIATGHYVRKIEKIDTSGKHNFMLYTGSDETKDQTYFLYTLNQGQLAASLFPLGAYRKSEVRSMARKAYLHVSDKKDSQGICFVGKIKLREFLKTRINEKPGPIMTTAGEMIGTHQGHFFYTLGQRKGIGVSAGRPYYIAAKNSQTNTLTVALGESNPRLFRQDLVISHIHWVSGCAPSLPLACQARIRYKQPAQEAVILPASGTTLRISFTAPQRSPTPGQSAVLYAGEEMLGGGTISA